MTLSKRHANFWRKIKRIIIASVLCFKVSQTILWIVWFNSTRGIMRSGWNFAICCISFISFLSSFALPITSQNMCPCSNGEESLKKIPKSPEMDEVIFQHLVVIFTGAETPVKWPGKPLFYQYIVSKLRARWMNNYIQSTRLYISLTINRAQVLQAFS